MSGGVDLLAWELGKTWTAEEHVYGEGARNGGRGWGWEVGGDGCGGGET